ncbi:hypothetical protein MKW98_026630 [Papaver atlanticum]|uniref:VQ domain-containing protein n=1 Tax=Papaver atlanticum TaxID=357466 RepID=A0AAD4S034_9MAGN|nr:hypothetical protein MKW98_026630 [Papaver atlanticum]
METRPSVRRGTNNSCTTNKYSIPKKISKPVKVVYISNPMKVKASVSEFRSLVQELTGRHSDISSISFDRLRFTTGSNEMESFQTVPHDDHPSENMKANSARNTTNDIIHQQQHGDFIQEVLGFDYPSWMNTSSGSLSSIFEPLYDVFVPEVMENMNGVFAHKPINGTTTNI